MAYAPADRDIYDADSHIMELPDFLKRYADPGLRDEIPEVSYSASIVTDEEVAVIMDQGGRHSDEHVAAQVALPATVEPDAGDQELARRIAPVLGDEDGHPVEPPPATQSSPESAIGSSRWKWMVWAAVVLLLGIISRTMLRPAAH